jgi:hypothetical protein
MDSLVQTQTALRSALNCSMFDGQDTVPQWKCRWSWPDQSMQEWVSASPLSSLASTWQMRSGTSCGCGHSNSCLNARPIARTAARLATISSLVGADMDVSGQSERLLPVVGHKSVNVELTFRLDRAVRLASASRPQLGGDPTHHARSEKDANDPEADRRRSRDEFLAETQAPANDSGIIVTLMIAMKQTGMVKSTCSGPFRNVLPQGRVRTTTL